jgi:NAD(P)H-dependent flavin oxidoreductase YrpB (nitropropane dioxygenase family)
MTISAARTLIVIGPSRRSFASIENCVVRSPLGRWRWCRRLSMPVSPIPVVASGGIFDGRGIAAALMLGAVGVNLGTRFITSKEAPGSEEWKQAILHANSEDSIKVG